MAFGDARNSQLKWRIGFGRVVWFSGGIQWSFRLRRWFGFGSLVYEDQIDCLGHWAAMEFLAAALVLCPVEVINQLVVIRLSHSSGGDGCSLVVAREFQLVWLRWFGLLKRCRDWWVLLLLSYCFPICSLILLYCCVLSFPFSFGWISSPHGFLLSVFSLFF